MQLCHLSSVQHLTSCHTNAFFGRSWRVRAYKGLSTNDKCRMCCRKDTVVVIMLGAEAAFEILNVMEYSSARGRMSVIARAPSGSVRLLSKGSDAKVIGILHKGVPKALLDATNSNLHLFATQVPGIPDGLTCFSSTVQWRPLCSSCRKCLRHIVDLS